MKLGWMECIWTVLHIFCWMSMYEAERVRLAVVAAVAVAVSVTGQCDFVSFIVLSVGWLTDAGVDGWRQWRWRFGSLRWFGCCFDYHCNFCYYYYSS